MLNGIIEYPKLFLVNYFSELRTEIDRSFAKKQLMHQSDHFILKTTNKKWNEFIQKIDLYEAELLQNLKNLKTNDLTHLHEEKIFKMLFANRTVVFLNNINENSEKLLYISNEYIGKYGIDYLKQR
jgi:hypothetical protein